MLPAADIIGEAGFSTKMGALDVVQQQDGGYKFVPHAYLQVQRSLPLLSQIIYVLDPFACFWALVMRRELSGGMRPPSAPQSCLANCCCACRESKPYLRRQPSWQPTL